MSKVKQIIRLRANGVALQTIANSIGIARNTVKKYLKLIEIKNYSYEYLMDQEDEQLEALLADPDEASQARYEALEAMFPYLIKELPCTGVTRWILWGEYKEKHPDGYSYPQFCRYLRQWMASKGVTMHFEHEPGDRMYIDFAGKKLYITDPRTGETTEVEVYVAILGYSQLTYVQAVRSQKKEDFIMATEKALHYFGGAPRVMIPDNLKSAVHKASKYEAEINADFMDFANHYGIAVLPARSYKPRDKSLAESAVNIAYSRIYAPMRNKVFHSIETLNQEILALLQEHNQKHFQKEPVSRRQRFEQVEKEKLMPLPQDRYEMKSFKYVKLMKNSYIQLTEDKHYYSAPYRYIGKKVKVVYSASTVSIFYNRERVAFHKRSYKRFDHTTVSEHLPSTHQFVADWNPDKFLNWAAGIDPKVKVYITAILESKPYPEQAYRSCVGILSQEKKVGKERLVNAVERATHYGVYNYKIIDRILKGGLDRLKEDIYDEKQASLPFHENIRGADNYR